MKRKLTILTLMFFSLACFGQVEIIKDSTFMRGDTVIAYNIRIATTTIDTSGVIFVTEAQADINIADLQEIIAEQTNSINNDLSFYNTALKRKNPRAVAAQKINKQSAELRKSQESLLRQLRIKKLFKR